MLQASISTAMQGKTVLVYSATKERAMELCRLARKALADSLVQFTWETRITLHGGGELQFSWQGEWVKNFSGDVFQRQVVEHGDDEVEDWVRSEVTDADFGKVPPTRFERTVIDD